MCPFAVAEASQEANGPDRDTLAGDIASMGKPAGLSTAHDIELSHFCREDKVWVTLGKRHSISMQELP